MTTNNNDKTHVTEGIDQLIAEIDKAQSDVQRTMNSQVVSVVQLQRWKAALQELVKDIRATEGVEQDWQPIETAPKDGTAFIVHGGMARWYVGDDCDGAWYSITGYAYPGRRIEWPVTHWMPLPLPPIALASCAAHDKDDKQS